MPIYLVSNKALLNSQIPRLIRAKNKSQALKYVADDFVVETAGQEELVKFVAAGAAVEDAPEASEKTASVEA